MKDYLQLLNTLLQHGQPRQDRTGTGTLSLFGQQLRFRLDKVFPAITTKRLHMPAVIHELIWFLRGDSNLQYLHQNKVHIWDEWADKKGDLGPVYGVQWRSWPSPDGNSIDQIEKLLANLRQHPESRRLLVSAWNVSALDQMALAPCHVLFQLYAEGDQLSCQVYQRSADVFLGLPFNIASYALLLMLLAQLSDRRAKELIFCLGDVHLYNNHISQAKQQIQRQPLPPPQMTINPKLQQLRELCYEDFMLHNYRFHPAISAPIAV